jgi:RimJ/RimL family protein N-acetyltransferase
MMPTDIKLESDRLLLRPMVLDDFDSLHALTVPEKMRTYLGPTKPSRDESFQRLMRHAGGWALFGFGMFAVIEKSSGAFIGTNGLFMGKRELGDDFDPYPETGWIIADAYWGQGIATKSAQMAHEWMDATFNPKRTVCMISPGNIASLKIADKFGYQKIGVRLYKTEPMICLARVRF